MHVIRDFDYYEIAETWTILI